MPIRRIFSREEMYCDYCTWRIEPNQPAYRDDAAEVTGCSQRCCKDADRLSRHVDAKQPIDAAFLSFTIAAVQ